MNLALKLRKIKAKNKARDPCTKNRTLRGLEWICRKDTGNMAMHIKYSEIVVSRHQVSIVSSCASFAVYRAGV